jgi:hypothetical protein
MGGCQAVCAVWPSQAGKQASKEARHAWLHAMLCEKQHSTGMLPTPGSCQPAPVQMTPAWLARRAR